MGNRLVACSFGKSLLCTRLSLVLVDRKLLLLLYLLIISILQLQSDCQATLQFSHSAKRESKRLRMRIKKRWRILEVQFRLLTYLFLKIRFQLATAEFSEPEKQRDFHQVRTHW